MQIQTKKSNRKLIIIAAVVAILLIGGAVTFYLLQQQPKDTSSTIDTTNDNPLTEEEKRQAEKEKDESTKTPTEPAKDEGHTPTTPPDTNDKVVINRASQISSGQPLNIRATVIGLADGTCEAALTKSGQATITKSFAIVYDATTATCGAADIPASEFPVSGQWQLQLIAKNATTSTNAATTQVTITK